MLKRDSGELGNGSAFMKVMAPIYGLYGVESKLWIGILQNTFTAIVYQTIFSII